MRSDILTLVYCTKNTLIWFMYNLNEVIRQNTGRITTRLHFQYLNSLGNIII